MQFLPFQAKSDTVSGTPTSSSSQVTLGSFGTAQSAGAYRTVRVTNGHSDSVYIKFGNSSVTTSLTTGMRLFPNSVEIFTVGFDDDTAAIISPTVSASANVGFTSGIGS